MRRAALLALALLLAGSALPAFAEEPVPEAWRDFLHSLPADRRARAEESMERLNPESRARILRRFEQMSASDREELERLVSGEPPSSRAEEKRVELENNLAAWRELSPAEREALRERLRAFRALPSQDQEALVERRFAGHPPDERREILSRLRSAGLPRR
jgi:hypothetical protein